MIGLAISTMEAANGPDFSHLPSDALHHVFEQLLKPGTGDGTGLPLSEFVTRYATVRQTCKHWSEVRQEGSAFEVFSARACGGCIGIGTAPIQRVWGAGKAEHMHEQVALPPPPRRLPAFET